MYLCKSRKKETNETDYSSPDEFDYRIMHSGCVEMHQIRKWLPCISQVEAGHLVLEWSVNNHIRRKYTNGCEHVCTEVQKLLWRIQQNKI